MARQTKADRMNEYHKKQALELRNEQARTRNEVVVNDRSDLMQVETRFRFPERTADALYTALGEVASLKASVETKMGWASDKLAELKRNLSEGRIYSSVPMQNIDDLNMTYGRLCAAVEAAKSLCYALQVYCPSLQTDYDRKRRETFLSFTVVAVTNGFAVLRDGVAATDPATGESLPAYSEEWLAWRAVGAFVNGY